MKSYLIKLLAVAVLLGQVTMSYAAVLMDAGNSGKSAKRTIPTPISAYTCYVSGGTKKCYCLVDANPSLPGCQ